MHDVKESYPDKTSDPGPQNQCSTPSQCYRMDAKGYLRAQIRGLRQRADALQALLDQLPGKLSPAADEALWSILSRQNV